MKTAQSWFDTMPHGSGDSYDVAHVPESQMLPIIGSIQLDAFRAGMEYAASLRPKLEPNECDGCDRLKQVIRETAVKLKALP